VNKSSSLDRVNAVAAYFLTVMPQPWPDIALGPEAEGLPFRYATTVDGSLPNAVVQSVSEILGFELLISGDYVASNIPLYPTHIVTHRLVPISPEARQEVEAWLDTWPTPTEGRARRAAQELPQFSEQLSRPQKALLAKLYVVGAVYPEPSEVELARPEAFAGLEFWYAARRAGEHSKPIQDLMERIVLAPAFHAALSGDFLAVNGALPPKLLVEFGLLPIGKKSRSELETWMERHAIHELGEAMMQIDQDRGLYTSGKDADPFLVELGLENVHPVDEQAEDGRFQRHMDTLLGYVGLLNAILPRLGVHQPAMIFDSGATSLHIGPIIAQQTAEGWQIGDFPYEEPDLTVPTGAAFDWNDVLDAALAARENQRKGDSSADHYLAVINTAMQIRTVAAYAWVEAYSDTTSPSHEMAVQELARALGREAYLEAAGG